MAEERQLPLGESEQPEPTRPEEVETPEDGASMAERVPPAGDRPGLERDARAPRRRRGGEGGGSTRRQPSPPAPPAPKIQRLQGQYRALDRNRKRIARKIQVLKKREEKAKQHVFEEKCRIAGEALVREHKGDIGSLAIRRRVDRYIDDERSRALFGLPPKLG